MAELMGRKDVPLELTWDLSALYASEELLLADLQKAEELTEVIEKKYKGKLTDPKTINECMDLYQQLFEYLLKACGGAELAVAVDYYDVHNRELSGRCSMKGAELRSRLSFVESEMKEQDESILQEAIAFDNGNSGYLRNLLREKAHTLHPEAERALAALSRSFNAPYEVYENLKLADMHFPSFTVRGKEYTLGYSLFEDTYEYEPDTEVRRAAFQAFSAKIKEYENGTATAYNSLVQTEATMAKLRGFDSVIDSLLFGQNVSRELYNRQIDLIMEHLAPHMRKYAKLLQRVHGLEHMTYADLKLPVDPDYTPSVTIEDSRDYIKNGLAVLGEDYGKMIDRAYEERWVDFAQNQGKSTGGFCASPYGGHSYILLSWNEKMSDVFTLAHELGHAGHFRLCNEAQSLFDTDVSNYFVEAPSTMNELLMAHYMLKTSEDKRFRRWVLSNMIGNTYYHNFVTHLLEAAYQREVYLKVDQGIDLQAQTLNEIMRNTLEKFWGDTVELSEGAELTWMRQPHYYMGLYSYTYSAGLTVATQMCKRIENEGESAVQDWMKALSIGSKLAPVEWASYAGVDITTDAALLDTIATIGEMIDEICKLTEELEEE